MEYIIKAYIYTSFRSAEVLKMLISSPQHFRKNV